MTLAAALAVGFALPAGNALAAKEDKAAADSNVIWVVDPSPVNWLWITWNTMEEHGPLLRLPGHQVSLSAHETKLAGRALALLETSGLKPPKFNELAVQLGAEPQPLRTLLKRLAQNGEIHLVSADYFFARAVIDDLAAKTAGITKNNAGEPFGVAQFRAETGVSRNMTIPLLEFFDRVGFTLRVGEGRKVRSRDQGSGFRDHRK